MTPLTAEKIAELGATTAENGAQPHPNPGGRRMSEIAIDLSPCPFCEGPPVPFVERYVGKGYVERKDDYGDNGLFVEAYVFCHECGAQGPGVEAFIYDAQEFDEIERKGVEAWQERNNRHRCLFDGGLPEGLNKYPRPTLEGER